MKSINNLLLLGDGENWNRQTVDFAGLPEMVRTFLQVAAGAADIPVTRLLGQSPAGLSATGESDTRNYYDMIAARQELELRPALERLDRVIAASEGIDPDSLTFAFRPLWQLDAATAATIALQKAQATQVYAGLKLWPAATTARLVEAQLAEDGTYPNAAAVFGEGGATKVGDALSVMDMPVVRRGSLPNEERHEGEKQPRDWHGRYASWGDETDAADPSGSGEGPHAPDGTPIEPASAKSRARLLAKGIGALLGLAGRLIQRWRPEEPDESDTPSQPKIEQKLKPSDQSIQFGNNPEQHYHAFRHVDDVGLDRSAVESAIRKDLSSRLDRTQPGLNQSGVEVSGQKLNYNAFMFSDGGVNVGRITIAR